MAQNVPPHNSAEPANPLLTALALPDPSARQKEILEILGALDQDRAVTLLFDALLHSANSEARKQIVRHLGQIGSQKAVNLLLAITKDDFDPEVQRAALETLRLVGTESAVDALLIILNGGDDFLGWEAARALGSFTSEKVVDGLIEATKSPFLRSQPAIHSLANIGSDRAVERLVEVLLEFKPHKDMDSYYAMEALVRLASKRAVDGLLEAWMNAKSLVGDRLYLHLRQFKPKRLIEPVSQRLQNTENAPAVRSAAAEILGLIGTENEIPLLESIWKTSNGESEREVGWRALRSAEQISYEELKRKAERERALEETRAFIAHEFRHALTPLNAYAKMLDTALAESEISKEKLSELVKRIRRQTDTAFDLVNQYLDYSRPLNPQFVESDLNQILQDSLEEAKSALEQRRIRLFSELATAANAMVDPKMLAQVLRNILTNAIEAIDQDGDLIVKTNVFGEYIRISIRDSGPGVLPENLSNVFDIGFSTKSSTRGAGVGLALSKRIIEEAHRGSIEISNNDDGPGATVTITLPKEQQEKGNGRPYPTFANR